jgi:hypothetical protein
LVTAANEHITVESVEAATVTMTLEAGNKKLSVRLQADEAKVLAAMLCSAVEEMG